MTSRRALRVFVAALGATAVIQRAQAQTADGFALDRFEPAEVGSWWFSGDSLDLRGEGRLILGAVGDWAYKPLAVYRDDDYVRAVVRHQLFGHLGAAFVMADRYRVALSVPLLLLERGSRVTIDGTSYAPRSGFALGDPRLSGDVRLLGEFDDPLTLALGLAVHVPVGNRDAYASDGKARIVPRVQVAGWLGAFTYAGRVGTNFRTQRANFADQAFGTEVLVSVAAGLALLDRKLVVGPELYGSTVVSDAGHGILARRTTPFELVLGGHYQAGDWLFGAGLGPGLTQGFGAPKLRTLVSAAWSPEPEEEAPPPPPDRDADGIVDAQDACPDVPGVRSDDPNRNGCPSDRDGDGMVDAEDACIDVPGVKSDDPKLNGCPPPPPDRDKDTILDSEDACPDEPGAKSVDPKKNGCPVIQLSAEMITILERVEFETAKATLRPESDRVLQAVADAMKSHPEIKKVSIEGHTDNRGGAALNRKLSADRAESVKQWLVDHGIAADRLTTRGFGPDKPIASNKTDEGRQTNRRVEFRIIESTGPVNVKDSASAAGEAASPRGEGSQP